MIALSLRFPVGRYHATPWGRYVNEAAIAWPPEPLRILRALIACHHRKADRAAFSDESLAELVDALARDLPRYRLPDAIHGHSRHFMPLGRKRASGEDETALVLDAFARFDPDEALIVAWPEVALAAPQRAHLEHLIANLGYFGRAESWVEAVVVDRNDDRFNAEPEDAHGEGEESGRDDERRLVPVYAPRQPDDWQTVRAHLIGEESSRRRAAWSKKSKPTEAALIRDMKGFLATVPERLADAIAVDTADLQAAGWSEPPAARRVLYRAPEPVTTWRGARGSHLRREPRNPTVARFILAGRPRPRIEDAVKIAEIMRAATMSKFGREMVDGSKRHRVPSVISGRGADSRPLRADRHDHAFWLPEDADGDGEIDHVAVYAAAGFDAECRRALDLVTRLWLDQPGRAGGDEDEPDDRGRKEWRLALEGFGQPADFATGSPLLGRSKRWVSLTPYLMPWHLKKGFGWEDQIRREIDERGLQKPETVVEVGAIRIKDRERRPIHFHRFRSRRGLRQPDTIGRFVELAFSQAIPGPLAIGFGCHFGLGLFRRISEPAAEQPLRDASPQGLNPSAA